MPLSSLVAQTPTVRSTPSDVAPSAENVPVKFETVNFSPVPLDARQSSNSTLQPVQQSCRRGPPHALPVDMDKPAVCGCTASARQVLPAQVFSGLGTLFRIQVVRVRLLVIPLRLQLFHVPPVSVRLLIISRYSFYSNYFWMTRGTIAFAGQAPAADRGSNQRARLTQSVWPSSFSFYFIFASA